MIKSFRHSTITFCCRALVAWTIVTAGCVAVGPNGQPRPVPVQYPNPALVPTRDHQLLWRVLVDVVRDNFKIQNEQRVQQVGDVLTEGRIDTFPRGGATYLEPHRDDSFGPYNRLESTLQTIRRHAHIRVIPDEDGFFVDVAVLKELEDLPQPEQARAGAATFRSDTAPNFAGRDTASRDPYTGGSWIALGRDVALEQKILSRVYAGVGVPHPGVAY